MFYNKCSQINLQDLNLIPAVAANILQQKLRIQTLQQLLDLGQNDDKFTELINCISQVFQDWDELKQVAQFIQYFISNANLQRTGCVTQLQKRNISKFMTQVMFIVPDIEHLKQTLTDIVIFLCEDFFGRILSHQIRSKEWPQKLSVKIIDHQNDKVIIESEQEFPEHTQQLTTVLQIQQDMQLLQQLQNAVVRCVCDNYQTLLSQVQNNYKLQVIFLASELIKQDIDIGGSCEEADVLQAAQEPGNTNLGKIVDEISVKNIEDESAVETKNSDQEIVNNNCQQQISNVQDENNNNVERNNVSGNCESKLVCVDDVDVKSVKFSDLLQRIINKSQTVQEIYDEFEEVKDRVLSKRKRVRL
eukprot:TRINITY_DN31281_c0_g1_i1.p1 TRINITY_DN31281_c0_g1~~TRINITY_DN31281_c0_g1_i1.p1  ORF type:complete len:374 (-),score=31.78 TRINITY_DN31281_c0_g1_i1:194-1273(-)